MQKCWEWRCVGFGSLGNLISDKEFVFFGSLVSVWTCKDLVAALHHVATPFVFFAVTRPRMGLMGDSGPRCQESRDRLDSYAQEQARSSYISHTHVGG
jgi:hypothetical protein